MPDASPAKWHLAHTSWFFEEFCCSRAVPAIGPTTRASAICSTRTTTRSDRCMRAPAAACCPGRPWPRCWRTARTSTSHAELLRRGRPSERRADIVTLGLHHEQQHQELLLTDIKHLFCVQSAATRLHGTRRRTWRARPPLAVPALPAGSSRSATPGAGASASTTSSRATAVLAPFAARQPPGHQRGVPGIRARRRLRTAAAVAVGGLGRGAA